MNNAISGIIGAVAGAAVANILAYYFWKRRHAAEALLSEERTIRETRLVITDRLSNIVSGLFNSPNAANPAYERQRQVTLLKGMREPIKRFFSEAVLNGFDSLVKREPEGKLEDDAEHLIPLMYDESLKLK